VCLQEAGQRPGFYLYGLYRNLLAERPFAPNHILLSALAAQPEVPSPLGLLLRVNVLTAWRRFKALGEHSRLLTAVIIVFISSYLVLAYWLFFFSLRYIILKFPGLGPFLVERLLFLLFAFLFVLLLLSNLVISYSNLFRRYRRAPFFSGNSSNLRCWPRGRFCS
jgi:hypothetical protein